MKKTELLHSEISHLIAGLGHQDMIVIGDSGLPVPKHVRKIDLALTRGIPGFMDTLKAVLSELYVERAWIAQEIGGRIGTVFPGFHDALNGVPVESMPHDDFKRLMAERAVAVIRTGECTPYANIMLRSGVVF